MQFWYRPSSRATYCSMLLAVCCSQYVAPRATYTYKNIHLREQHIALVSAAVCLLAFPLQDVADGATYHKQKLYKTFPREQHISLVSAAVSCAWLRISGIVLLTDQHQASSTLRAAHCRDGHRHHSHRYHSHRHHSHIIS